MTRSIVLLLLVNSTRVFAQAPVPMHEEPRHRLVLAHQQLRVMDVKIRPRDTTMFHIHDVPARYVAVSAAPVDIQLLDGTWGGTHPAADPGRKPGDVNVDTSYVRQPITHRVTNVGPQLFNLIAITNSTVSPEDSGSSEMPGALELSESLVHSEPRPTICRCSAAMVFGPLADDRRSTAAGSGYGVAGIR